MTTLPDSFADYRHEIVRDLAWLIHSPDLISLPQELSANWLFEHSQIQTRLKYFDINPDELVGKLRQQACYRLGYYFEDLVRLYLRYFIQPLELKSNIQVYKDKATVGEYDFLMQLANGEKVHLETAVKFYLYNGDSQSGRVLSNFLGPNKSDRLDRKWNRLMDHQINLSNTIAGSDQAEALDLLPSRRSLLIKGYLFYPFSEWREFPVISPVNPSHARGWWLKGSETQQLPNEARYTILMKPQWLAPALVKYHNSMSYEELCATMQPDLNTPLLIAELVKSNRSGVWQERSRGFVVPDNWDQ